MLQNAKEFPLPNTQPIAEASNKQIILQSNIYILFKQTTYVVKTYKYHVKETILINSQNMSIFQK